MCLVRMEFQQKTKFISSANSWFCVFLRQISHMHACKRTDIVFILLTHSTYCKWNNSKKNNENLLEFPFFPIFCGRIHQITFLDQSVELPHKSFTRCKVLMTKSVRQWGDKWIDKSCSGWKRRMTRTIVEHKKWSHQMAQANADRWCNFLYMKIIALIVAHIFGLYEKLRHPL